MVDFPVGLRVLNTSNALILDVSNANGYFIEEITMPERIWRRSTIESDDVEGNVEVQSVLAVASYDIVIRCEGSTTAVVETRRSNLLTAVENRVFHLEVTLDGSVTVWKANRADSVTSAEKMYLHNHLRRVNLKVPVQPRPL